MMAFREVTFMLKEVLHRVFFCTFSTSVSNCTELYPFLHVIVNSVVPFVGSALCTSGNDLAQSMNFKTSSPRSEEHTSELQSHRDLHSFPTRRSSDLLLACDSKLGRTLRWVRALYLW